MINDPLNSTIEKKVQDLTANKYEQMESWRILKKELKKRKLPDYEERIYKVDADQAKKVLEILLKLDKYFEYKDMNYEPEQLERIITISKMDGDIFEMLQTLADTNYEINLYTTERKKKILCSTDIEIFEKLVKDDLYLKYAKVFKALNKSFGYEYKNIRDDIYYRQVGRIIQLSETVEQTYGAIYVLANQGYKIDKKSRTGLTNGDIQGINELIELFNKGNHDFQTNICLYLYNTHDIQNFTNYFSILEPESKIKVVNKMFESDKENREIIEFLNKKFPEVIRDAGFM